MLTIVVVAVVLFVVIKMLTGGVNSATDGVNHLTRLADRASAALDKKLAEQKAAKASRQDDQ